MTIRFTPVSEILDPLTLSIGLSGGSGTGKTYSALLIARGIAEVVTGQKGAPIGYIDTENRRALHYRTAFPEMVHCDMSAVDADGNMVGFGPERWIEYIDAAEDANLPAVVVDSFSHSWGGVGGVLELHAQTLAEMVADAEKRAAGRYTVDPAKFNMLAWAHVKPRYRRLVDRIVRAKCNIVICTRAKPVMQKGFGDKSKNAFQVKTRRDDIPWNPEADGDLMFEMTTMVILDPSAPGCPVHQIKVADQFKGLLDPRRPMGVETGRAMAEWARGHGNAQAEKQILDAARDAARQGRVELNRLWREASKSDRSIIQTILDNELKPMAVRADEQAASNEGDDLFAGDDADDDTSPTPEDLERAEREAREEIQRRDAEHSGRAA